MKDNMKLHPSSIARIVLVPALVCGASALAQTTERLSTSSAAVQGNALSSQPVISIDGRIVAYYSDATNLVTGDTNGVRDVFLRDLALGITTRVSLTAAGAQATGLSSGPTISGNGRFVAFYSDASNLVPGDTNGVEDCFVRDRGALAAQPFCFGDGSQATACPCGNNGAAGKGCANSTPGNQGALVVASGNTVPDTIVLSASAMPSGSTVIFLQGTQRASTGMMYGDGILCASGNYFRLGLKTSVGGAATYPEAADPAISVRSAALGDPVMSSGLCRYYQVYYTDPSTTFCPNPPGNVWNVTNGVALVW